MEDEGLLHSRNGDPGASHADALRQEKRRLTSGELFGGAMRPRSHDRP